MKLIEPSMQYDKQIQAYRREFLEQGGSMDGVGSLRIFERTQDWLDQVESFKHAETTPPDFVQSTQYIYVRETDEKIVGMIQIRHDFNEFLKEYGGHIGYSVCPSERRKGYATQMLRLVLPKCKELGIDKVLITCIQGNEASRKVILTNGGLFEKTVYEAERNRYLERYWIDLSGDAYNAEAKEKWGGTEAYAEFARKTKAYSEDRFADIHSGLENIFRAFAELMQSKAAPDSVEAQALVKKLQAYISEHYYTCTAEILTGLGQMYVADERFRNYIDKNGDGTAAFICKAIEAR